MTDKQRTIPAEVAYLDLEDVTKVINSYENPKYNENYVKRFHAPDMGFEQTITKMKAEAMKGYADYLKSKKEPSRAIGGNLNHLRKGISITRRLEILICMEESATHLG